MVIDAVIIAFQNLWEGFLSFLPNLIGAIVILVVGGVVSYVFGKWTTSLLNLFRINQLFDKSQWDEALAKAGIKTNATEFIGRIVKWIFVIVFLSAAVEVLGLVSFADFLSKVVAWLPNVLTAVVIFVVAVIVADLLEKVVKAMIEKAKIGYSSVAGAIVRWSIYVFAFLAILLQLGIAVSLVQMMFAGFVALIVLSCGIAFGLGGKEVAADILTNLRKKLRE